MALKDWHLLISLLCQSTAPHSSQCSNWKPLIKMNYWPGSMWRQKLNCHFRSVTCHQNWNIYVLTCREVEKLKKECDKGFNWFGCCEKEGSVWRIVNRRWEQKQKQCWKCAKQTQHLLEIWNRMLVIRFVLFTKKLCLIKHRKQPFIPVYLHWHISP